MDIVCTPDIKIEPSEVPEASPSFGLSKKSKEIYETTYEALQKWKQLHDISDTSESVLLLYFKDLSAKYKPTSLWTIYSMLKSTIILYERINIEAFEGLQDFLKEKSESFQPKQAKIFSPDDIKRFLHDSPDAQYLAIKVALIMGVVGACHSIEMYKMKISDLKDLNSALIVSIPSAKIRKGRKFTITDSFYTICKKYLSGRTSQTNTYVFHQYRQGKLLSTRVGKNNFIVMGRNIATYLKLDEPDTYSGHSFRKSAGTVFVGAAGDLTALRRNVRRKTFISSPEAKVVDEPSATTNTTNGESFKTSPITIEPVEPGSETYTLNFNFNDKTKNVGQFPHMTFKNCSITINNNTG